MKVTRRCSIDIEILISAGTVQAKIVLLTGAICTKVRSSDLRILAIVFYGLQEIKVLSEI